MNLDTFQRLAHDHSKAELGSTALDLSILGLGISGEAGEVSDEIKKALRDDGGYITNEPRESIVNELGDCLWYVSAIADFLGCSLSEVANIQIEKLKELRITKYDKGD